MIPSAKSGRHLRQGSSHYRNESDAIRCAEEMMVGIDRRWRAKVQGAGTNFLGGHRKTSPLP